MAKARVEEARKHARTLKMWGAFSIVLGIALIIAGAYLWGVITGATGGATPTEQTELLHDVGNMVVILIGCLGLIVILDGAVDWYYAGKIDGILRELTG